MVSSLFPPLAGPDKKTARTPIAMWQQVPLHRLKLPMFQKTRDPLIHIKLQAIQQEFRRYKIPHEDWSLYTIPCLVGPYLRVASLAEADSTKWYELVFAIICCSGLRAYYQNRLDSFLRPPLDGLSSLLRHAQEHLQFTPMVYESPLSRREAFMNQVYAIDPVAAVMKRESLQKADPAPRQPTANKRESRSPW